SLSQQLISSSILPLFYFVARDPAELPTGTSLFLRSTCRSIRYSNFSTFGRASDGTTGCGWIFEFPIPHDSHQGTSSFKHTRSPLIGEALAMRSALSHALDLGITRVCVYSDCQQLVRAILSKSPPVELYGIARDIDTLSLQFDVFSLSFISRNFNVTADLLAKTALCNIPYLQ
ncbi:hypothetical protein BRARA_H00612, partial [Brassica rapa]